MNKGIIYCEGKYSLTWVLIKLKFKTNISWGKLGWDLWRSILGEHMADIKPGVTINQPILNSIED